MLGSLGSEGNVKVCEVHAVRGEVVDAGIHLHVGKGEFNVVLLLGQVVENGLLIDLIKALYDRLDLLLSVSRAVGRGTGEALVGGAEVGDTVLDISVPALHDGSGRLLEVLEEDILVAEALSEIIPVLMGGEHGDGAGDVASEFLAGLNLTVRERLPGNVALLLHLLGENTVSEGLASLCVLLLGPECIGLGEGHVSAHSELHGVDRGETLVLSGEVDGAVDRGVEVVVLDEGVE